MQKKSTPQVKTPAKRMSLKRKSLANASPDQNGSAKTPVGKKNTQNAFTVVPFEKATGDDAHTPSLNKVENAKTPQRNNNKTPKNVESTPEKKTTPQTGNKANNTGGKQKRKQSLPPTGDEGSSPKQQKVAMFAGSSNLNDSTDNKTKTPVKSKKGKDGAPLSSSPKTNARIEQRNIKRKERRSAIRKAFEALNEGRPLSPTFINSVSYSIQALEKRAKLTKSAKKKLANYRKIQKRYQEATGANNTQQQISDGKQKPATVKQGKKGGNKKKPALNKPKDDAAAASDSDYDTEENVNVDTVAKSLNDDDEEQENGTDEDDSDEEVSDDDAEEEEEEEEEKTGEKAVNKKQNANDGKTKVNKSRYVLFVGNLPYEADEKEIIEHFSKVGKVKDVRLPFTVTDKGKKPKGIAYVEFEDSQTYEVRILITRM